MGVFTRCVLDPSVIVCVCACVCECVCMYVCVCVHSLFYLLPLLQLTSFYRLLAQLYSTMMTLLDLTSSHPTPRYFAIVQVLLSISYFLFLISLYSSMHFHLDLLRLIHSYLNHPHTHYHHPSLCSPYHSYHFLH